MSAGPGPRRAAIFLGDLSYGGGERVAIEQARALSARGTVVDVWGLKDDAPKDVAAAFREANPRVRHVETLASAGRVFRRLLRHRYDLVVTSSGPRAYRALMRLARVPLARRPAVVETVHERYRRAFDDPEGRRRRVVHAWHLTHDFRDALHAALGIPRGRAVVARPLFPSSLLVLDDATRVRGLALRASLGAGAGAVVVGYLGRLASNKGLVHLLPMAGRLVRAGRDVHLVVAGRPFRGDPGFDARLEDARARAVAEEPRLAGRLHFVGPLPSRRAAFAAFDVTVLCSRVEGLLPLALVESMSCGVPVVTTDVGGIGSCLRDGVDASVVKKVPDDEAEPVPAVLLEFEARLARLVDDPAERRRLGAAGKARVKALVAANDFSGDFLRAVDLAMEVRRRS